MGSGRQVTCPPNLGVNSSESISEQNLREERKKVRRKRVTEEIIRISRRNSIACARKPMLFLASYGISKIA